MSFQPEFRGSFQSSFTWSVVSPVCHREFRRYSPGPVLDFTAWDRGEPAQCVHRGFNTAASPKAKFQQGIPSAGFLYLQLNARLGHCPEGVCLPVGLLHLLPHHHVEAGAVLVAKDEPGVVIVRGRVDVEGALEVHPVKGCVPCQGQQNRARIQLGRRILPGAIWTLCTTGSSG